MNRSIQYALGVAFALGLSVYGGCGDDETAATPTAAPTAAPTGSAGSVCGDGTCDGDETCETCEPDCGQCPAPSCGDGHTESPQQVEAP